jgi:hypothetical protein
MIITDFTILALVEALSNNSTVEQLSLAGCVYVTTAGWVSFPPLFGNSDLKKVDLGWNWETVTDEVITSFVEELRENTTLESLGLNCSTHLITNNGWREPSNLLCDKSGINATRCHSNHTLHDLMIHDPAQKIPRGIKILLEMNKIIDKEQVSRMKVIRAHFSGAFDINAFSQDETQRFKMIPNAIAWLGQDAVGITAVYDIIRSMPDISENNDVDMSL